MSELSNQILSGDIPTPPMSQLMAPPGSWYQVSGVLTTTHINRAREAMARLIQGGSPSWVNVPVFERAALAGEYGPEAKAIFIALGLARQHAAESSADSSLAEWTRKGQPSPEVSLF